MSSPNACRRLRLWLYTFPIRYRIAFDRRRAMLSPLLLLLQRRDALRAWPDSSFTARFLVVLPFLSAADGIDYIPLTQKLQVAHRYTHGLNSRE